MADCCANCKFVLIQGDSGICRRNPPSAHLMMQQGPQGPVLNVQGCWPPVRMEQWCGEHRKGLVMASVDDARLLGAHVAGTG